jgi:exopolyphosphatase/guanosine-5'-triphosphate,3'-diphosphate pyrophosphatase
MTPGPSPEDREAVAELLGRPPQGGFEVVVRNPDGSPVVIRNAPFLDDGTPMPTRFWLVDPQLCRRVGELESAGGVRRAEAEVDQAELAAAHQRYAAERDAAVPTDHAGPRPSGGVGGTRRGVKCLHAHLAWYLAGGDDPVGRWVQRQLETAAPGRAPVTGRWQDGQMRAPVAAIDCGTNSVRLLIRGPDGRPLERLMRITRLGQGVDASGRLDEQAVERTLAVLREYREVMDRFGVERVRVAATSAARDAGNRDEFFDAAEVVVGVRPELLSGLEEAQLSFLGATAELDPASGPFLVVDIGGGSTEFAYGTTTCEASLSTDMGCVRMTEKYLHHDPPLPEELLAAISVADIHLDDVIRAIPEAPEAKTFVGLAGTVTTAAAVELGLATYDRDRIHHFVLTKAAAEDVFRTLATEPLADRVHNPGLEPERADVIVGGMCVLVAIMRRLGFSACLVSESDILDGLAMSIAD